MPHLLLLLQWLLMAVLLLQLVVAGVAVLVSQRQLHGPASGSCVCTSAGESFASVGVPGAADNLCYQPKVAAARSVCGPAALLATALLAS